jgi:hypothetical protein
MIIPVDTSYIPDYCAKILNILINKKRIHH